MSKTDDEQSLDGEEDEEEIVIADADLYRKQVSRAVVKVSSGLHFQTKALEFPDFMHVIDEMMEEFDNVTEDNVFAVAIDVKNPDTMYAYAKKVLPLTMVSPRMVAEEDEKAGAGGNVLAVTELAPMDVYRLNMASMMGKSRALDMMASFRPGESVPEIGDESSTENEPQTE